MMAAVFDGTFRRRSESSDSDTQDYGQPVRRPSWPSSAGRCVDPSRNQNDDPPTATGTALFRSLSPATRGESRSTSSPAGTDDQRPQLEVNTSSRFTIPSPQNASSSSLHTFTSAAKRRSKHDDSSTHDGARRPWGSSLPSASLTNQSKQHRRASPSNVGKVDTSGVSAVAVQHQQGLRTRSSAALSKLCSAEVLGNSDVALLSPSVAALGVGSYRDQKLFAVKNAELRHQLRLLRDQRREADREREALNRQHALSEPDDTLEAVALDTASVMANIEAIKRSLESVEQLSVDGKQSLQLLQQEVAAERLARNSLQNVLFERSDALRAWKHATAVERKRREESKLNALLQRQLAIASAGSRAQRPPAEVRAELSQLKELVEVMQKEEASLREQLVHLEDVEIRDARCRAVSLLAADDEFENRIHSLLQYIQSAQKVIQSAQFSHETHDDLSDRRK